MRITSSVTSICFLLFYTLCGLSTQIPVEIMNEKSKLREKQSSLQSAVKHSVSKPTSTFIYNKQTAAFVRC
jgi:hypothetical protein